MAFEYGDKLAPETAPALDAYTAKAQEGYGDEQANLRREAMRELDAEIAGRDQQGRQAGFQRMATDQGLTDEADRFKSGLGMKRAELGESLRVRGQQRGWDVADRDFRLARLREQAKARQKIKDDEARGGAMGEIGGGIGTVAGGLVGGYFSGWNPAVMMAGAAGGGAAGGAIGSAV